MGRERNRQQFALAIRDNKATIDIDGVIGQWEWDDENKTYTRISGKKIRRELDRLAAADVTHITVRINSLGGLVNDAIQIHDALKDHKARVTTLITGLCASAATIIAMAGDERLMSPNALMLIHKCWSYTYGNENELEEELDTQRKTNEIMMNTYREHWKGTEEELKELMDANYGHGRWLRSGEAVRYGLCTGEHKPEKGGGDAQASIMAMLGMPELPQAREAESLMQRLRNLFAPAAETPEEPAGPDTDETETETKETGDGAGPHNQTQTQTQNTEDMKRFKATFALLSLILTAWAEKDYDPAKGVTLSENELGDIENRIGALEKEKASLETAKAQAEKERDEYKAKYEALPAREDTPSGEDPKPGKSAETTAEYVKRDPFYQAVAENEGLEL